MLQLLLRMLSLQELAFELEDMFVSLDNVLAVLHKAMGTE